jgi:ubiquinol-cytochrome c reductase cytochrome b subunit
VKRDPIADPLRFVDRRLGASPFLKKSLRYVFPDHWSFLFGEMALYSFIFLVLSGIFLTFFFVPSYNDTVYQGSYAPLQGAVGSEAWVSVVQISFDVKLGLLMRQAHHWAANLFLASIVIHLMRIFFTGAFRKPRELNYVVGVTLLLLALLDGYLGYSQIDDLLSGMGLIIGYAVALSIPLVGGQLAILLWGDEYPARIPNVFDERMFINHVLIIPAIMGVLIAAHLAMIVRLHHAQFPGPGRRQRNTVGSPMWSTYALRSLGLMAAVFAVLILLGGLVQINPIFLWGPYEIYLSTNAAQPDWYLGWLIGALRIMPPLEIQIGGRTYIPNPFFGGAGFPILVFIFLYAWPWFEQRVLSRDFRRHDLLDRPRDNPARTATGIAVLTFVLCVELAGASDRIFLSLGIPYTGQVWFFRFATPILPVFTFLLALWWCRRLKARDDHPLRGSPAQAVVRDQLGLVHHLDAAPDGRRAEQLASALVEASRDGDGDGAGPASGDGAGRRGARRPD